MCGKNERILIFKYFIVVFKKQRKMKRVKKFLNNIEGSNSDPIELQKLLMFTLVEFFFLM